MKEQQVREHPRVPQSTPDHPWWRMRSWKPCKTLPRGLCNVFIVDRACNVFIVDRACNVFLIDQVFATYLKKLIGQVYTNAQKEAKEARPYLQPPIIPPLPPLAALPPPPAPQPARAYLTATHQQRSPMQPMQRGRTGGRALD
jgi:hypothetical protein